MGLADQVPTKLWSVYAAGTEKDKSFGAEVREEFQRFQRAEEERRGMFEEELLVISSSLSGAGSSVRSSGPK